MPVPPPLPLLALPPLPPLLPLPPLRGPPRQPLCPARRGPRLRDRLGGGRGSGSGCGPGPVTAPAEGYKGPGGRGVLSSLLTHAEGYKAITTTGGGGDRARATRSPPSITLPPKSRGGRHQSQRRRGAPSLPTPPGPPGTRTPLCPHARTRTNTYKHVHSLTHLRVRHPPALIHNPPPLDLFRVLTHIFIYV